MEGRHPEGFFLKSAYGGRTQRGVVCELGHFYWLPQDLGVPDSAGGFASPDPLRFLFPDGRAVKDEFGGSAMS